MSRRRRAVHRIIEGDPRYNSPLIARLINGVMCRGKKHLARRIVYRAFDCVGERLEKQDPIELMEVVFGNTCPQVEVKSRRVGGATYQVPMEIDRSRQIGLVLRWLVMAARNRKGTAMQEGLASELLDAYNNVGAVVKKKDEMHRMAQANRAFAHFRWS